jgi:hypothetical protein
MTKKTDETAKTRSQACKHEWKFNQDTKIFECAKCGTPAPKDWNEVPF